MNWMDGCPQRDRRRLRRPTREIRSEKRKRRRRQWCMREGRKEGRKEGRRREGGLRDFPRSEEGDWSRLGGSGRTDRPSCGGGGGGYLRKWTCLWTRFLWGQLGLLRRSTRLLRRTDWLWVEGAAPFQTTSCTARRELSHLRRCARAAFLFPWEGEEGRRR